MDELEKMRSGDFYQMTAPEVEHIKKPGSSGTMSLGRAIIWTGQPSSCA
ncbi:hypothetical protein [Lactobacillus delbrueckii]|nr:hypothetical protein [Lactobacillus delbrueckii]